MAGKERLLTGLQPSGSLHIGNYFGALKPFVDEYEKYESFLMIVDYHALTSLKDPDTLRKNTLSAAMDYLAVGVDPTKAIMFKQSDVSEHTELAWIFETLVTVPFLMQAHGYKDKVAKGIEATAGLFNYPMLMAADILLYDADVVPVGKDNKQNIEYTREAVTKFNNAYKEVFTPPQELILDSVAVVPGTDGEKMSKSYKNTVPLFGTKEEITKAVMSIQTDSDGDFPKHVFNIHKLYRDESELKAFYDENKNNYKALKEELADNICSFMQDAQERRNELEKNPDEVIKVLQEGAEKAKTIASKKMEIVKKAIGIL
jgi:tryptophanyl-tRNA synthetase